MRMRSTLVIARRAFAMLEADCLAHPSTETGGLLVGQKVGGDFVVPFVVEAGPKAQRSRTGFSPDAEWQQHQLGYFFERFGCNFIGDHHRHPNRYERPSAIDLEVARHIVTDAEWDTPEAVFPIATIQAGIVRLRAFLMKRDADDFQEIPIEVVSDNDRRIRRVLLAEPKPTKEVHRDTCVSCGQPRGSRRRAAIRILSGVRTRSSR